METETNRSGSPRSEITRRAFLGGTGALAASFMIVPRRVLGGAGYVAPNDKVNIAFIGTGSQGLRVMLGFLREQDVQGVAVCDPNKSGAALSAMGKERVSRRRARALGHKLGMGMAEPRRADRAHAGGYRL